MCEVKWIKITTDMFDNRKIKHLRRLPEGNNIVLIWIMLLTMAGRCNSGGMIFLTENIPYTTKMLSDELDFEENTVQLALQALEQLGMIVMNNNFLSIAGWQEHQNIEGMEKIKEQTRVRVANHREKQKLIAKRNVTCNVTVTQCNATDIDIDKDKDIDKEKENKESKKERPHSGYDAILAEIPDDTLRETYHEYIKMRKMIKAPMTDRALQMLINKVEQLEPGNTERQKLLLDTAILNNWKSVYPLKDNQTRSYGRTAEEKNAGYCINPNEDSLDDLFP